MEIREIDVHSPLLSSKDLTFTPDNLNALVRVEKPSEIGARVKNQAVELGMDLKDEFHISVIASKNGRALKIGISLQPNREELEAFIAGEFKRLPWSYRLLPEYFLMEKSYSRDELKQSGYGDEVPEHTRYTIVQKVQLPNLGEFYEAINGRCGLDLIIPPPHITLYSGASYEQMAQRGIGIYSEYDFKNYLKRSLP